MELVKNIGYIIILMFELNVIHLSKGHVTAFTQKV